MIATLLPVQVAEWNGQMLGCAVEKSPHSVEARRKALVLGLVGNMSGNRTVSGLVFQKCSHGGTLCRPQRHLIGGRVCSSWGTIALQVSPESWRSTHGPLSALLSQRSCHTENLPATEPSQTRRGLLTMLRTTLYEIP